MKNKLLIRNFLFLGVFMLFSFAQAQSVTGTVSDVNGPLPGANVIVKGTTNGVMTDFEGNYMIDNVDSNAILEFSFVGFGTQDINVNGQSVINVTLTEDVNQLDEVVVVGYTTQTRGDITGSVASVDMDEASKVPVANAAEALQGRVTGVNVVSSAAPGAAPKITIRGFGTSNNTNPLYIIDGVQTDDANVFNSINPADIDQMNVLKDGAAAIYGARASNGVIIVTTKSGGYNMDKSTLSLDIYSGFSQATNMPDLLNASQHADVLLESLQNDRLSNPDLVISHPQYDPNATGTFTVPTMLNVREPVTVKSPNGTYWPDEITQTAPTTNVSLALQNGTESGKYFMSVNYFTRDGILNYSGFERYATRLNSEFKLLDGRMRIGEHMNLSMTDGNAGHGEAIENSVRSSPLLPVYDDNGEFAGTYSNSAGLGNARNGAAQLYRAKDDFNKSLRAFGDIYIEVDILEGLMFKSTFNASILHFDRRTFAPLDPEHGEPLSTQTLTNQDQYSLDWGWTNILTWNKSFGEHNISAIAGTEAIKGSGAGKEVSRTGYLFEDPDFYTLANGSGIPNVAYQYEYENSLFSIFGSVNYNYADKYFLTATLRNDTSSRFAGDNKSGTFPSFSAGWALSKEDFFPQDGIVSNLRLKGSWGQLGNQTVPGDNPTINISSLNEQYANYATNGSAISTGAVLNQVGNPDLNWETSETMNFGFDLGLFDGKLYTSFEWYNIETKDLITRDYSLISTTAIDAEAPLVNLGSVENTGIDWSIGWHDQTDSEFTYGIDFNFSHYKNEVTELINEFQSGRTDLRGGAMTRTQVGQPLSSYYGKIVDGIDDTGRFAYRDINDDGVINDDDRTFIGSPHPDFTYGLNISLGFAGFDMAAFFTGSQGNDLYNYNKIYTDFPTFFNGNRSTRTLDSWTPSNTNASLPALSQTIQNGETNPNSYFVEDGSYFRMKNLQLGYSLPQKAVEKMRMTSLRFYLQGTNLFTISDYDGIDPELVSDDNLSLGVDYRIYPLSQIYSLGVNIKL